MYNIIYMYVYINKVTTDPSIVNLRNLNGDPSHCAQCRAISGSDQRQHTPELSLKRRQDLSCGP